MSRFISGSVGVGGVNLREDVRVIQELLNQVPPGQGAPAPLLDTDGVVGPKTIAAIRAFQQHHFGWNDGRVDVNNVTIARLNSFDRTPTGGPPVRFRHEDPIDPANPLRPNDPLDGFDETATPFHWLLVPFRGTNRVLLFNTRFSLLTSNRSVVTAERVFERGTLGRLFAGVVEVHGVSIGDAFIRVLDGSGNEVARLDVSVRQQRTFSVAFRYVDNAGVGTARQVGDEVGFLATMNEIYNRQTHIRFVSAGAQRVTIRDNLGTEVNTIGNFTNGEWPNIVNARTRNNAAQFNIFFVREVETDAEGTLNPSTGALTDTVDAVTDGAHRDCIFEDAAGTDMGATLAHEAGHALGEPDLSNARFLMHGITDARARKISKDQALRMHRDVLRPSARP
jgi:peptidoglycan hydrolase-like protein with peptidoglycan-binding domain